MSRKAGSLPKSILLRILPQKYIRLIKFMLKAQWRVEQLERNVQRITTTLAYAQYGDTLLQQRLAKSVINEHEYGVHSQNGEDGILLYIFSQVGTTNRFFVEFGIEDGRECNSANLCINFGWQGLYMELDPMYVESARNYYDMMLGDRREDVKILQTLITPENINTLLTQNQTPTEPDLFSIDIDSFDYWVWEALDVVKPRVMSVEYNAVYGPTRSLTIPRKQGMFDRHSYHYSGFYFGASLTALTRLANKKGYELVGCDSSGTNAFFVRKDVLKGDLKPVTPEQAYYPSMAYNSDVRQDGRVDIPEQFPYIEHLEFVNIE